MHLKKIIFIPLLVVAALVTHSCSTCSRQQTIAPITIDLADLAVDTSYIRMATKVFYSLPTPIEVSILIKNSGISYQSQLLNQPANANKYLTSQKMSLNFGTYITDMTYAGLFEQAQTVLSYKNAIQQLADQLGILAAIDNNTMQRIESNINNRDELLRVISETYASCTSYLDEDDRYFLALSMLIGGWVEGMYIATSLTEEQHSLTKERMRQLVVDQKLTFDLLWKAMSDVQDHPDIAALMDEMKGLAMLYDQIGTEMGQNKVGYDPDEKITTLESTHTDNVTPEMYAAIKSQIQTVRSNFTKF